MARAGVGGRPWPAAATPLWQCHARTARRRTCELVASQVAAGRVGQGSGMLSCVGCPQQNAASRSLHGRSRETSGSSQALAAAMAAAAAAAGTLIPPHCSPPHSCVSCANLDAPPQLAGSEPARRGRAARAAPVGFQRKRRPFGVQAVQASSPAGQRSGAQRSAGAHCRAGRDARHPPFSRLPLRLRMASCGRVPGAPQAAGSSPAQAASRQPPAALQSDRLALARALVRLLRAPSLRAPPLQAASLQALPRTATKHALLTRQLV